MKAVFLTQLDSQNFKSKHTALFHQKRILEKYFDELIMLDNTFKRFDVLSKVPAFYYKYILKNNFHRSRNVFIFKQIGKYISKQLEKIKADIVFAPGSLDMAFVKCRSKKIIWTDATFNNLLNYYESYKNLPDLNVNSGHILEKEGLENTDLILFTSEWAKNDALNFYKINENKIAVLPLGADLIRLDKENHNIKPDILKLAFIGIDWKRKGGDLIFQIVSILVNNNIKVHLDIIGISPDIPSHLADCVTNHGFLNKSNPSESERINSILGNSSFFIMPSEAEALGIVYLEANSHGIPVIARDTGGVSEIVKHGINGIILDSDNASDYADEIMKYFNNFEKYLELRNSSFEYFSNNLTWDVIESQFITRINNLFQ